MITISEKERQAIKRHGHMPTLLAILQKEYKERQERLVDEQNNFIKLQGSTQMLRDIISLIED